MVGAAGLDCFVVPVVHGGSCLSARDEVAAVLQDPRDLSFPQPTFPCWSRLDQTAAVALVCMKGGDAVRQHFWLHSSAEVVKGT